MRIGELADILGINPRTIRFYESKGLLPEPDRTPSGYRSYADQDADRLTFIKTAQRIGLSLDEIAEIIGLRDRGQQPCGYVMELIHRQVSELDRQIAEMGRLRDALTRLEADTAAQQNPDANYCCLIEHVRNKRPGTDRRSGAESVKPRPVPHNPRALRTAARQRSEQVK